MDASKKDDINPSITWRGSYRLETTVPNAKSRLKSGNAPEHRALPYLT